MDFKSLFHVSFVYESEEHFHIVLYKYTGYREAKFLREVLECGVLGQCYGCTFVHIFHMNASTSHELLVCD